MLPEITVHRPRGVLPKVAVHQRTVIDYQPSWLLLAIKAAIAVLLAKRSIGCRLSSWRTARPSDARGGACDLLFGHGGGGSGIADPVDVCGAGDC